MDYSEIYEKAVEKAENLCCPYCESNGTLEYADDEVLVCNNCKFSVEAEDLQSVWQDKIEDESGFYDVPDEFREDD